jgi:hypothetical protein
MNYKYIINQGSGGLVHMLGGIAYCCNYVNKYNNCKLIIDTINHNAFNNYFSKYFTLNNIIFYEDYNCIQNEKRYYGIPLVEFSKKNAEYIPKKGYIFSYKKPNNKVIDINLNNSLEKQEGNILFYVGNGGNNKKYILDYIKCNDDIKIKLNKLKLNEKYIAVHFRNTDRFNDINLFINKIKNYKNSKIYIATDDYKALKIFKEKLPEHNFITYTTPYNANGKNIHFNNPNKDEVVMNILIDMYMMFHSHIFIPSENSLISRLVIYMRENNKSIFN